MRCNCRHHQKGASFIGFVVIAALAVAVFSIGGQSLLILWEYQTTKNAVHQAVQQAKTEVEIRQSFDRRALVDNIETISGQDLKITDVDHQLVVSFAYERAISLVGPAYLVYRFKYQTP